jgi:hypothetical protein
MNAAQDKFIANISNGLKFFLFKWLNLPSLAFWGVKLGSMGKDKCEVKIRHGWSNKNPFGSLYFSALAGSAELSTGLPVLWATQGSDYSMLVVGSTATFTKKAKGTITFTCDQVNQVFDKLAKLEKGASTEFDLTSVGKDEAGDVIGNFSFHWSIKKR